MLGRLRPHDRARRRGRRGRGEAVSGEAASGTRLTAWAHGHVQGVGFRWATRVRALELGLTGYAKNYPDGRVLVIADGPASACDGLLAWLEGPAAPGSVSAVVSDVGDARGGYEAIGRAHVCTPVTFRS